MSISFYQLCFFTRHCSLSAQQRVNSNFYASTSAIASFRVFRKHLPHFLSLLFLMKSIAAVMQIFSARARFASSAIVVISLTLAMPTIRRISSRPVTAEVLSGKIGKRLSMLMRTCCVGDIRQAFRKFGLPIVSFILHIEI